MKKGLLLLVAISSLLVFTACSERREAYNAVVRLSVFVDDVEQNAPQFSDQDWKEKDTDYNALIKEIDKHRYSSDEVHQIGKLKGRYIGIRTKYHGIDLIKRIDNAYEDIKGQFEGFKDGLIGTHDSTDNN